MPLSCPQCGLEEISVNAGTCPKCDATLRGQFLRGLLVVDVAHSGQTVDDALDLIHTFLDRALRDGHKGLKVIHGHGSKGHRARIKPEVVKLLRGLATSQGGKVVADKDNPGAHIFYFS